MRLQRTRQGLWNRGLATAALVVVLAGVGGPTAVADPGGGAGTVAVAPEADTEPWGDPPQAQAEPPLPGAVASGSPQAGSQAFTSTSAAEAVHNRPADGYFRFQGQGSGHGRGLSQYGAKGAADAGRSGGEILDFYYPNSYSSQVSAEHPIRVWISYGQGAAGSPRSGVDDSPVVSGVTGLVVTDTLAGRTVTLPSGTSAITTRAKGVGFEVLATVGTSSRVVAATSGPVLFSGPSPLTLTFGSTTRSYRGTISAVRVGAGAMTVNTLPLDQYLRSVVPREMPSYWPDAALRAQTVAARTYAVANLRPDRDYDICDTTYCQVYGGTSFAGGEVAATDAAITATAGTIRRYQGMPINAQFGASSGGFTVDGGVGYLKAAADPWDRAGIPAGLAVWEEAVPVATLERAYPAIGTLRSLSVLSRDGKGAFGGRVLEIRLVGSAGSLVVTGNSVRSVAGLETNLFTVLAPNGSMNPVGAFDSAARTAYGARLSGWAVDPDIADAAATLRISVTWGTRVEVYTRVANTVRNDVATRYPQYGPNHGFVTDVPFTGVGAVSVCVVAVNTGLGTGDRSLGCKQFVATAPTGRLDRATAQDRTVTVSGWALSRDAKAESLRVAVSWTGPSSGNVRRWADGVRNDIATAYPGAGSLHGVHVEVPVTAAGTYRFCLSTDQISSGQARVALGCRDVVVG